MKRLLVSCLLLGFVACGEPPPPPPPPPSTPAPKISLVPSAEQIKNVIGQMDKSVATKEQSDIMACFNEPQSKENTILALLDGAKDTRPKVRANVAQTIRLISKKPENRDDRLMDALILLLEDPDGWTQIEAASALGVFCNKKLVPLMIARMEDKKNIEKTEAARQALQSMAGENAGNTAAAWKKWWLVNEATFDDKCKAKT
jgi:hypothetical protein